MHAKRLSQLRLRVENGAASLACVPDLDTAGARRMRSRTCCSQSAAGRRALRRARACRARAACWRAPRQRYSQPIPLVSQLATATRLTYARRVPHAARTIPRSRALTLLAWLLCALLGPGPALPALHFALVAHRVCPEHGALEHIDAASPELEAAAGAARGVPDTGSSISPGRALADAHGHEPCGVAGIGSSAVVPRAELAARASAWGQV